jgi:hypothetical protein
MRSGGWTSPRWGGAGAGCLGLAGRVSVEEYRAVFGLGGCRHPGTGRQLVGVRWPGFALSFGVHRTVAVLDVAGRTDHVHAIVHAGTEAAMG